MSKIVKLTDLKEYNQQLLDKVTTMIGSGGESNNLEAGSGRVSVQQIADGVADGFDFTGKNEVANSIELPEKNIFPVTGLIEYGATGEFSSAFGGKSAASGRRSAAFGTTTIAKGKYSLATGENSVAYGDTTFVSGMQTSAYGYASSAHGGQTVALGDASHAFNYRSAAVGAYSFATGVETCAEFDASATFGRHTISSNDSQFVVGQYNEATLENAFFVVGNGGPDQNGTIQGHNAFVVYEDGRASVMTAPRERDDVVRLEELYAINTNFQALQNAFDTMPISEGVGTSSVQQLSAYAGGTQSAAFTQGRATNVLGFAAGPNATAGGYGATAFGANTVSSGDYAFVAGVGTKSSGTGVAAFGRYNKEDSAALFYVGNGGGDASRSNAFMVLSDGRAKSYVDLSKTQLEDNDLVTVAFMKQYIKDNFATLIEEYFKNNQVTFDGGDAGSHEPIAIVGETTLV